jgi:uncharacterized OB-fold protein
MIKSSTHPPLVEAGLFSVDPPALLGGRCERCGAMRFPHRNVCAVCQATNVSLAPLSTTGTVYTFTIVRNKPPGYVGDVPYAYGLVDLPDGLRVISTIAADDVEKIAIGDAVEFELLPIGSGEQAALSYCFRRVKK